MGKCKKAVLDIQQILAEYGAVTVDKAVDILKQYEPAPNPKKLEDQYWKAKARRALKAKRDSAGICDAYSDEKGTYYNVPTNKNKGALQDIDSQITTKVKKLIKVRNKVRARRLIIEGQLILDLELDAKLTGTNGK